MKVTNHASFPVVAFGVHVQRGYGDDVTIQPGQSADVSGPYVGEMDGCSYYVHIDGELACHEKPDDDSGFEIARGKPICLQSGSKGITIRHHEDPAESYVTHWRARNAR